MCGSGVSKGCRARCGSTCRQSNPAAGRSRGSATFRGRCCSTARNSTCAFTFLSRPSPPSAPISPARCAAAAAAGPKPVDAIPSKCACRTPAGRASAWTYAEQICAPSLPRSGAPPCSRTHRRRRRRRRRQGLARLATEDYRRVTGSNLRSRFMHLTNYRSGQSPTPPGPSPCA